MTNGIDRSEALVALASEALNSFELIADAAAGHLGQRGPGLDAFANINELNAARAVENLARIQADLNGAYRRLRDEPAIARVVVADENDNRSTYYVCRATPVDCDVMLCSSLGPKGRLASLPVGDFARIQLPSGFVDLEVIEKATFKPTCPSGSWDSRDSVVQSENFGPLTVASMRALLIRAGVGDDELDLLEQLLAESSEAANIQEGLRRSVLVAMQLRDQPILDKFQDEIFRLPIDRQLMILGPPGTGKTTTLVRRLRQKIDFEYLEPDETALVEGDTGISLPHAQSWLMFTPTELLKQYVREAFAREGVPAPEQRIRTWDDHRHELARRTLPILRSATGGAFVLNEKVDTLQPPTLIDQIPWFEDFDRAQQAAFVEQLTLDAEAISRGHDPAIERLGRRLVDLLGKTGERPMPATLAAIANLDDELRRLVGELRDETDQQLRRLLAQQVNHDREILDDLGHFVGTIGEAEDDPDDPDADSDDEEEAPTPSRQGRAAAQAAFLRALRAKAIADVRKRPVGRGSRNDKVLEWLTQRSIELPDLVPVGAVLLIQRATRRLMTAAPRYVRNVPSRYRSFRRSRMSEGKWYLDAGLAAADITRPEIDAVLLAILRNARSLLKDPLFMRRVGGTLPPILDDIRRLYRNQILVDEATDFSPVQLACMAALTNPRTESFFACGDFNQRLTIWGSRSTDHLSWTYPNLEIRAIDVAYRQSRRLNDLARGLMSAGGETALGRLPEHMDNEGVSPVLGTSLGVQSELVAWLAARITEIEVFTGQLPSIAILVNDKDQLLPLATALNETLASQNIRVVACPDGQVMGQENDVRVFEVQHIKGLEFEAVFFVDVDHLEQEHPDLFDKYLYVGATRAATYLGVTCGMERVPPSLERLKHMFAENW